MILSPKDILKTCDYYISYRFLPNQQGMITVSWEPAAIYIVKWNPALEAVVTNWKDQVIPCPKYASSDIAYLLLKDVCRHHKYPLHWVHYFLHDNPTSTFFFDIMGEDEDHEDRKKAADLGVITESLELHGLRKEEIGMAQEFGVWDGLKSIAEYRLGIKINDETAIKY